MAKRRLRRVISNFIAPRYAKLNSVKFGLALGIFFAILHAVWALLVAIGGAQQFINWVMPLHFIDNLYSVASFDLGVSVLLIVIAFICGYVMGWLLAWLYNRLL
mgnify:CR=1 FL=1